MQIAHFVLFVVALAISGASAGWVEDGCNEVICYKTGPNEAHPNPRDKCSYCCCYEDSLLGKHANYRSCMYDRHFDPITQECVGGGCQSPQTCEDIETCNVGHSFIAPNDPSGCTFCCCENGTPKTSRCPNYGGYFGAFVESEGRCIPSPNCGKVY